jgi:hypothetical protein
MESPEITMTTTPEEMRALASWYRERAEPTENPTIWERRLRTAEDLEEKAMQADCRPPSDSPDPPRPVQADFAPAGSTRRFRSPIINTPIINTRVSPISSLSVRGRAHGRRSTRRADGFPARQSLLGDRPIDGDRVLAIPRNPARMEPRLGGPLRSSTHLLWLRGGCQIWASLDGLRSSTHLLWLRGLRARTGKSGGLGDLD